MPSNVLPVRRVEHHVFCTGHCHTLAKGSIKQKPQLDSFLSGRIIVVKKASLDFSNLQYRQGYSSWVATTRVVASSILVVARTLPMHISTTSSSSAGVQAEKRLVVASMEPPWLWENSKTRELRIITLDAPLHGFHC